MSKRDAFGGFGLGVVLMLAVSWLAGSASRDGGSKALSAEQRQDPAALRIADLAGTGGPDAAAGPAGAQDTIGAIGPTGCVVVGPPGETGPAGPDGNDDLAGV
jgi:hypothetical protein